MRLTGARQGVIEPRDLRGQPGDMSLDGVLDTRWRGVQPGALGIVYGSFRGIEKTWNIL
jgi:hypothetical protein